MRGFKLNPEWNSYIRIIDSGFDLLMPRARNEYGRERPRAREEDNKRKKGGACWQKSPSSALVDADASPGSTMQAVVRSLREVPALERSL